MKVSFLSPVYNEEKHLTEMISHLTRQPEPDWELVLVDDGSSDATPEIIRNAMASDPRIVLASDGVKLGKTRAFNLAFEHSTGDVIAILGGDDRPTECAVSARQMAMNDAPELSAAYFKLRMFSDDPRFDGVILPRGQKGSRSGPSITLSRGLASLLFPIPPELPSEDIWLGEASEDLAKQVFEGQQVVIDYRVHGGNSNPRQEDFQSMSQAMAIRLEAYRLLLERTDLGLSAEKQRYLGALWTAEQHRRNGDTLGVLATRGLSVIDRLGMASQSDPRLHAIRSRFYKFFSGRRGR